MRCAGVAPRSAPMNGEIVAVVIMTVVYFGVLVVVALEPHEPGRQGRHRRDLSTGAR